MERLPISPIFRSLLIACLLLPSAVAVGECEVESGDSAGLLQTISHEAVNRNNTFATNETQRTPSVAFTQIQEAAMFGVLPTQHLIQASQGENGMSQSAADAVAGLLLLLQFAAVSPVAYYDSVSALLVVLLYLCSVTSVKFFVKDAINNGFAYPACITGFHMVGVCLTILAWGERPKWQEAKAVLPISLLNGASLLTNNAALVFGGLAFVSMIDAMGPFVTFLLEVAKGKRPCFNVMTIFSVTIASLGSVLCVHGEANTVTGISLTAITLAGLSAVLRSMRAVWQHDLLMDTATSVSPLHLVFWNGFWTFWTTAITMMFTQEHAQGFTHMFTVSTLARAFLFLSIPAAVTLNITQWYAVKKHGALMQNIIGNLNLVTVIAISKAVLLEEVTGAQYTGTLLLVLGTVLNKAVDVKQIQGLSDPQKLVKEDINQISDPQKVVKEEVK